MDDTNNGGQTPNPMGMPPTGTAPEPTSAPDPMGSGVTPMPTPPAQPGTEPPAAPAWTPEPAAPPAGPAPETPVGMPPANEPAAGAGGPAGTETPGTGTGM